MIELAYDDGDAIRKAAIFVAELKRQGIEFKATVEGNLMLVELHGY